MQKKGVLIVTPFFAPQTHAAVFRAHKLAKGLAAKGHPVHVICTLQNYNYKEDPQLMDELGEGITVHRLNYIEPSLRGFRMRMKKSTSIAGEIEVKTQTINNDSASSVKKSSWFKSLYHSLLKNMLFSPDEYWTWIDPAVRLGGKLISQGKVSTVYSTSYPYSTMLIAEKLQAKGLKWVVDFRDPLTFCHRTAGQNEKIKKNRRQIVARALEKADAVCGLSSCYDLIFSDMYPDGKPCQFIPTGLDRELLPEENSISPLAEPYIIYTGEYLAGYDGHFFAVFQQALQSREFRELKVKVVIVGYELKNRNNMKSILTNLDLAEHIIFKDHMPQQQLYRWIKHANAGLLNPGRRLNWWTNFSKMVDFIATGTPVVACVGNPSEARKELTRAGLGVFLDSDIEADARLLQQFFANPTQWSVDSQVQQQYLASAMVEDFAKVIQQWD